MEKNLFVVLENLHDKVEEVSAALNSEPNDLITQWCVKELLSMENCSIDDLAKELEENESTENNSNK